MKVLIRSLGLVMLALLPSGAQAVVRSGEIVEIPVGEVIDGDLYAAGSQVNVLGEVTGDVVAAASIVSIRGRVGGDLLAAAGTVNVEGKVDGSVRAAGGQLNLTGSIGEDAAIAGGQLDLAKGASIGHDLLAAGGMVSVNGPVGGDVWAAGNELRLAGPVEGNVNASAEQLRLGEGARVGGDLTYRSGRQAELAPGATVAGQVSRDVTARAGRGAGLLVLFWIRSLVATFALGLLVVLAFPNFTRESLDALRAAPAKSLGLGAAAVFGVPVLAAVLIAVGALIGGWWLGLLLLFLYTVALALCFPIIGAFIGRWLFDRLRKPGVHRALVLLAGLAILTLLVRVPVLGALVFFATILFGLGAMIVGGIELRRTTVPA